MAAAIRDLFDRVRRPEYTGENRCVPCTVVNLVIAAALALVVARGVAAVRPWPTAALAGAAAGILAGLVVALRGYL
ncbi:MAG: hypothetical protein ABEJ61_00830, partial [Haloferacaceae archaeon]